ncbi:uncharacterized protein LY89DRAFT_733253 [Mollisia scopiformis]|uniref:Uncharacterized protein n=1 Tax=Mollisia scopiformis TaxID=149040 RepID=A0A194XB49_MOLSC|nr:uncharacterized protein LY89DRAFT_733253 [Mollisia scopiformis]KUJ17400.1 hypothetical protein LY89DRAFT_733253 [Mollisia scopiformis]
MNLGMFAQLAALLALSPVIIGTPSYLRSPGVNVPTVIPTPENPDMTPILQALQAQGLNATFGRVRTSDASSTIENTERRSHSLEKRVIPTCITFGSTPYQDDCNYAKKLVINTAMNYDLAPYGCQRSRTIGSENDNSS